MKNKILTVIANLPIYLGIGLRYLSDKVIEFSFNLHILLGTDTGKQIAAAKEKLTKMAEAYQQAQQAIQNAGSEESKLASVIINAQPEQEQSEGVVDLAKKRNQIKN